MTRCIKHVVHHKFRTVWELPTVLGGEVAVVSMALLVAENGGKKPQISEKKQLC